MNFESFSTFTSKTDPDVTFVLRKMTRGRRVKFNLSNATLLENERILNREAEDVDEQVEPYRKAAQKLSCSCDHAPEDHNPATHACTAKDCRCRWPEIPNELLHKTIDIIRRREAMMNLEYEPAFVRFGLESIAGLVIDGKDATAETLIELGPEDLVTEISGEIKRLMGLSSEETKNSELPTTSGAPAAGRTDDLSAAPAVAAATI